MANKIGSIVAIEPSSGEVLAMVSAPSYDPSSLTGRDFSDNLKLLEKSFDIIFICADNSDSLSLCRAAQFQDAYHVMLSRNRFTKCHQLSQLVEIKKIQGLLYV